MKIKIYFTLAVILLLSGCASKYDKLYNAKPGYYSYVAGPLHSNNINEEHASKVYATPASCQKIVTSLIALKTLGPKFKYQTELFVIKKDGKIYDVIIKFSGDPTLTSEQLTSLLQSLQNSTISGHIFLDASIYKTSSYSHNLIIDDIGTDYTAPVSAINIDKNLIAIRIIAGKIGKSAIIQADPGYSVNSKVITNDQKSSVKLSWVDGLIHATGNINETDPVLELKISPQDHDKYVLHKINGVLSRLNIKGKIKIIRDKSLISPKATSKNKIESLPLEEIIKPALKNSDNLVYDSIYLSVINSNTEEEIYKWEQGSDIVKKLINTHFGIDAGSALFVDGSGLSRYNRIQPIVLFSLLKKGFEIPEFLNALARPGEENSTLKNRTQLSSNIIAKTGNMSGISCLCGYSFASYYPKAFVFMGSSFSPPSKELFEVMDSFINKNLGK